MIGKIYRVVAIGDAPNGAGWEVRCQRVEIAFAGCLVKATTDRTARRRVVNGISYGLAVRRRVIEAVG